MKIEEKGGRLKVVDFDRAEAYMIAEKIEKDGIRFYEYLADKEKNEQTKEIFRFLIEQERDHLRLFETRLVEEKSKSETEVCYEENDLFSSFDYQIFKPYEEQEHLENIVNSPRKALKLAIIMEERSIDFYAAVRERVEDPAAGEELTRIIDEEKKHMETFRRMLGRT